MKAVILADGDYPLHPAALAHLSGAGFIVCCDGSASKLESHGLEPAAIVGDMDSLSAALKEKYRDRLHPDSDQETNDLTKAVQWCSSAGFDSVVIVGATGLREDHTIGNISLLGEYCRFINAEIWTDTGVFSAYCGPVTLESFPGQQISLFTADPQMEITSTGLRYPLNRLKLTSWWRGTLNEAVADSFSLSFSGAWVIVFRKFENLRI